ncbi:unnamed protein product, partial [Vitis vinifera]
MHYIYCVHPCIICVHTCIILFLFPWLHIPLVRQ